MRYLILGASGFIGTQLSKELLKNVKNAVVLFSRTPPSDELLSNQRCCYIQGDFLAVDSFSYLLKDVDCVYHLVSATRPSNTNVNIPNEMTQLVGPTSLLLDACVEQKIKKVIFVSSGGTVYGKQNTPPFSEEAQVHPISAYGAHKVVLELVFELYGSLYGLNYNIVRLSNPYGPGQKTDGSLGVVTTFVDRAIHRNVAFVFGDGSVVRDYIYIDDAIKGLLSIESYQGDYKVFNLGSGSPVSVNGVIDSINKTLKVNMEVKYCSGRKADVPISYLDVGRFTSCFGYPAITPLAEGILKTADFLSNKDNMSTGV